MSPSDLPNKTLVVVEPSEYSDFTKPTIIDCNQVFELSREELVQKVVPRRAGSKVQNKGTAFAL